MRRVAISPGIDSALTARRAVVGVKWVAASVTVAAVARPVTRVATRAAVAGAAGADRVEHQPGGGP